MDNLTNDAQFLLSKMYAEYIANRKSKKTKLESIKFGNLDQIHKNIMPEWLIQDVYYTLKELQKHHFVELQEPTRGYGVQTCQLTTTAIAVMENKFHDKVEKVLDFASKVKSAIPFF